MSETPLEKLKKNHNWLILLVFILLIGIKLYYFSMTNNQPVWWDEADYLNQARAWSNTGPEWEMDIVRPILFPFVLSIFLKLGLGEWFIRLFELILGILAMYFLYKLTESLYNKYIAVIAVSMFGIFWSFTFYTMRILMDIPLVAMWIITAYVFWIGYTKKDRKYILWTGPLLAITFLTKFNGALLGFVILFYFLIADRKELKNKIWWRSATLCFATLIPFFIYEYTKFGHPLAFYIRAIVHKGGVVEQSLFANIKDFATIFPMMSQTYFILFIIGLISIIPIFVMFDKIIKNNTNKHNKEIFLLLLLIVPFLYHANLGHLGYGIEERYLLMVLAASFIIASLGLYKAYELIKKYNKQIAIFLVILVILIGGYQNIKQTDSLVKNKLNSLKQVQLAGQWLNENTEETDIIYSLTTQAEVQYNSKRKTKSVPGNNPEELIKELKENKIKYILINIFVQLGETDQWKVIYPLTQPDKFTPMIAYQPFIDQNQKIPIAVIYKVNHEAL